jgi:Transposase, Mutator family
MMPPIPGCNDATGALTADGRKELLAMEVGYRESTASWSELLRGLRDRGLAQAPLVAVGDGALGFWAALDQVFPTTRHQRCWNHRSLNVLDKLPRRLHAEARKQGAFDGHHVIKWPKLVPFSWPSTTRRRDGETPRSASQARRPSVRSSSSQRVSREELTTTATLLALCSTAARTGLRLPSAPAISPSEFTPMARP